MPIKYGRLYLAAALLLTGHTASASEKPNFIIVLADDLGYSDIGSYGGEIQTPTLDSLADSGLRFTQMYSTGRCWPSRSSLLTGYYAQQVDMDPRDVDMNDWPRWTRLLPEYLRNAGYQSYHSGKWQLRKTPLTHGFKHSYWLRDHERFFNPQEHSLDDVPLPPVDRDEGYYSTIAIADHAIDFLQDHHQTSVNEPFYLYVAFTAPHFPLHALQQDIDKYRGTFSSGWDEHRKQRVQRLKELDLVNSLELSPRHENVFNYWSLSVEQLQAEVDPGEVGRAIPWQNLNRRQQEYEASKMEVHAAMIDRMDQEIARIMAQVDVMGVASNTVFIFLSDNGATAEQLVRGDGHLMGSPSGSIDTHQTLGPGWSMAANTPFSLHKFWNHEGGISSPMIVNWPDGIMSRGGLRNTPAHFVDIVPTMFEIAGVTPALDWNGATAPAFPGQSLVPVFDKDQDWIDREFYFSHQGNMALRHGNWKIVKRRDNNNEWELYNIADDRVESRNLAERYPERLAQMTATWERKNHQYTNVDRFIGSERATSVSNPNR